MSRYKIEFDFNGTKEELEKMLDRTLRDEDKVKNFSSREAYPFEGVEFEDFIKDFITDEMDELSDEDEFYNSDSLIELLHSEDFMNWTPFCRSVREDEAFVNEYPDVADDILKEFGSDPKFIDLKTNHPGQFANYMIDRGMYDVLQQLPAIQKLDEQNLDGEGKKVFLSEDTFNIINDQMHGKNLDKTFEVYEEVQEEEEDR